MPKATSSRSPYRLSLPSPAGLTLRNTVYLRSIPSTPSPASKHAPRGPLHDFAEGRIPTAKQEETRSRVPVLLSPFERKPRLAAEEDVNEIGIVQLEGPEGVAPEALTVHTANLPNSDSESVPSHPYNLRRGSRVKRVPLRLQEYLHSDTIRQPRRAPASRGARATHSASNSASTCQLLRAQTEIEKLQAHVESLERSERRLKKRVSDGQELVKDLRVEVEEARAEVLHAEDKVDEMTAGMDALRRDFNQYRGWWLTENRSLKLVLRDVPKRKWNAGLQAIASSSYGRYMTYCGNGSN